MIKVFIKDSYYKIILNNGEKKDINDILQNVNIEEETYSYLAKLESQKVSGKAINELYNYKGVELYTFYRATMFMHLKEVFTCFFMIKNIIKEYGKDLDIITDNKVVFDISTLLFDVNVKFENKENIFEDKENTINNSKSILIKRALKGMSYFIKYKFSKAKNRTLVFTQAASINKISIRNKEIYYDALYGNIISNVKQSDNIFNVQFLNNFDLYDKSNLLSKDYFPFEMISIIKKAVGERLVDKNNIEDNLNMLNEFEYKYFDYNLREVIYKYVFNNLKSHYFSYVKEICVWERIIKILKINKALVVDEADRPRCIITAGNILNIDTFGLQHGIINQTSSAYITPTKNKKLVPKKTFVWGEKFKEFLITATNVYNEDNIVVIGQPRTDYLYEKVKEYNKINNDDEMKILFATQPICDLAEESLRMLLEALVEVKNYKLIIKLHPADNFENIYMDIINKYNIKNVEVTKSLDIYDALLWCDLVISVHSTVVLEGAIFNKPSICIILPKYNDEGNFVKEGLSLGVKNSNELRNILVNKEYLSECNYKKFIEKSFYKVDGSVSQRASNYLRHREDKR